MPSLWWGKPASKEVKETTTKGGNFFDVLIRRTLKSGRRVSNGVPSEKTSPMSASISPSLAVSRCHSFSEESHPQPLPLPVQLTSVDAWWGDVEVASVSTTSSVNMTDQTESRVLSPQASDYESGNITAVNSPARLKKHVKDQRKPLNQSSNDTLRRRRPLSSQVTKLQIPPNAGFISASGNSISCPSRSRTPVRPLSAEDQVNKSDFCVRRACSDNSIGNGLVYSSPGSPMLSPRMTSPRSRSLMQSGCATPGGVGCDLALDRPKSHKLPLPPASLSSYFSSNRGGRGDTSTSPVSRWKKGRMIGSGKFGHVYLGFNSETGEMCAMKEVTLFADDTKSKESAQQLGQEVMLLSRLRHPNIVQYFGSEMVDNKLYIYLEYVSGGSIHKLLGDYGQLGESAIRSFTRQILCGLAYLHARNTVHRDIKGANILVDPNGRVRVADFGMAKHITGQSGPLSFKGSPYWMAPEVIRNSDGSNIAVDIWSLGCTVIEMATAKPPWSQYEGVAALFKVGNSKEIPAIPDHLSMEGKDFVLKCLQRNPVDRPTAAQLLDHPFVKNAALARNCFLNSEGSYYADKVACLDLEGVAERLPGSLKFTSKSRSKHLSCPVSPISSPLRSPKSSQKTCLKRLPFTSSTRIASVSSTPLDCSMLRKNLCDARVDHRSKPETSVPIPEISRSSKCQIMQLGHRTQESFSQQTRVKPKSSFVRPSTY